MIVDMAPLTSNGWSRTVDDNDDNKGRRTGLSLPQRAVASSKRNTGSVENMAHSCRCAYNLHRHLSLYYNAT